MRAKTEKYIDFILNNLKEGKVNYSEVKDDFCGEYSLKERTFTKYWAIAQERFADYKSKLDDVIESSAIQTEAEAAKNLIRSKTDRLLIYQNQIDEVLKELKRKGIYFVEVVDNKRKRRFRPYTVTELTNLRNTLKNLQSEISKIEGDYAEARMKLSGDPQNPIITETSPFLSEKDENDYREYLIKKYRPKDRID
ncbi:MAG: hypothetical protein IAE62_08385 [Flavobacteriales bacterium]|nr:hypothetical protein [Flavobacteriales bacterium]